MSKEPANIRRVKEIEYQLLPGSSRKSVAIVIERDGKVTLKRPINCTPEQADAVVERKYLWICRNLAKYREINASAVVREYVKGESFLYLNRPYRLALVENQTCDLKIEKDFFCLNSQIIEQGGDAAAKKAFIAFYTEKGKQHFRDRVNYFAPKVGVQHLDLEIKIKTMQTRWASCGKRLNFNWRCMMASYTVIDYIVVHELCHLIHPNHSKLFWSEVEKVMPDYRERKEWLKKYGASLTI